MRIYPKGSSQPHQYVRIDTFSTTDPVAAMMMVPNVQSAADLSGLPVKVVIEKLLDHAGLACAK